MKEKAIELFNQFIYISENLDPVELWFVVCLAIVFLLYITYRALGIKVAMAVGFLVFFIYLLYDQNTVGTFKASQQNEAAYQQIVNEELQKNSIYD